MNVDDLEELADKHREEYAAVKTEIRVCTAASCQSSGALPVLEALTTGCDASDHAGCCVKQVGCMGLCSAGPLVAIAAKDAPLDQAQIYRDVAATDAPEILTSAKTGTPMERLHCPTEMPFFARQQRIVLENSGIVDPNSFKGYVALGGYHAMVHALTEMTPAEVIAEVTTSGLRGRGGGGYPTGLKWSTVAKMPATQKYVICNADEGDPGAFMDRAILESDPHRVLEGMAMAAYAIGANKGFVYIRAEYPLAVERLKTAIRKAKRAGFIGHHICETEFNFDIEIRLGAGAFVCGEETALMASIEGGRGQPRPRPPYPAESGLWGHPTLINNVETYANIAPIVREGGDWFAGIGTERSKGTKVFALAGAICNTGLIEVPMGTPLRDIIEAIGGGIPGGKAFKAVQTGGPSGGCIPEAHLDIPVDYDSLKTLGTIMGSGGMIVMDETSSMVEVARFFMEFCMSESCGKCIPCRAGTAQMHGLLDRIVKGEAGRQDLALLEELCEVVQATSLCGLGQTAPNPVLSTLRYFRAEYEQRLLEQAA
ncbi:NADH-quinone oxidoreductase subunit NuoF [Thiorhodovibrio frisius]|uniref:NADH-quinone oxidoreductase subunit F n=1 Tax=Thiorhodovibrio frisius TaxID=631362 RepID=H8Z5K3_9GAMM|nr:NADH-quinone oxidoreductase subunit NuoF [Thiorhodovibrio frisius]EIC20573.1 NADH:ubiquinone oxidoreductase, NADH-binding (51 kD) subunit [Thiorhodovibrio frisius]WPL21321.1 NADP-reducing hydrogenase subunit HndC [Thiorhodovibrio frisius]